MATYNYKGFLLMQQMYNFSWVNRLPRCRSSYNSTVEAFSTLVHIRTSCDLTSVLLGFHAASNGTTPRKIPKRAHISITTRRKLQVASSVTKFFIYPTECTTRYSRLKFTLKFHIKMLLPVSVNKPSSGSSHTTELIS
jgi:hypothetical protein